MKEILIFAGTTEGRRLSEYLAASGVRHTLSVATEYGEIVLKEHPLVSVRKGRLGKKEMTELMNERRFAAVVDATHPYAAVVTDNIRKAAEDADVFYLRLKRDVRAEKTGGDVTYFKTPEDCAAALRKYTGNILLTTGSKDLVAYAKEEKLRQRLYVRILPAAESLQLCMEQGVCGKQIIAMQGPFTAEMNEALIRQYDISVLVTKQSGVEGGYPEKAEAAKRTGIPLFVIGQAKTDDGNSFSEILSALEKICHINLQKRGKLHVILAGVGMGDKNSMTTEVKEAIAGADILLGAERVIEPYKAKIEKKPLYRANEILPYLKALQEDKKFSEEQRTVVVLFSGDSGFYSGSRQLFQALQEAEEVGELNVKIRILAGISSVSYLAARIGESYQDAAVLSMHGKNVPNFANRIMTEEKLFILTSGIEGVHFIAHACLKVGLADCRIVTGYRLSYPEEEIRERTPEECLNLQKDGLYTCFVRNSRAVRKNLTHGISDEMFLRGNVPMTKEEVRDVSICKLKLRQNAVVYDIGGGTGSVSVEIARLSDDISVYAIERKEEAVRLLEQNRDAFLLENMKIIKGSAPEALQQLPAATHTFIGGSGGNLKEILDTLYKKNKKMRVVLNAVSLETICAIREIITQYPVKNEEIVQLQTSRLKEAGRYHLMQAENPVWICAFEFCEE